MEEEEVGVEDYREENVMKHILKRLGAKDAVTQANSDDEDLVSEGEEKPKKKHKKKSSKRKKKTSHYKEKRKQKKEKEQEETTDESSDEEEKRKLKKKKQRKQQREEYSDKQNTLTKLLKLIKRMKRKKKSEKSNDDAKSSMEEEEKPPKKKIQPKKEVKEEKKTDELSSAIKMLEETKIKPYKSQEKIIVLVSQKQEISHEPDRFTFQTGTVQVRHAVDVDLNDYKTKLKILKRTYEEEGKETEKESLTGLIKSLDGQRTLQTTQLDDIYHSLGVRVVPENILHSL